MAEFVGSASLLLALLNPFLLVIYLLDPIEKFDQRQFGRILIRAGMIAAVVFCSFSILGDVVFSSVIRAEFASFQIFGGVIFLLIGLQFVFRGPATLEILRGSSAAVASALAMPILVGPGTISASVIIGNRHTPLVACAAVLAAVFVSLVMLALLKAAHDYVRPRRESVVSRYIEVAGRITALYVGTVAVDMIAQGIGTWMSKI